MNKTCYAGDCVIGEKGWLLIKLHRIWQKFLDILYPRHCPVCHGILKDPRRLVCPGCEQKLKPIQGPRCFRCGKPVGEDEEYCRECLIHNRAFSQGKGIFPYDRTMKKAIIMYKYYGCREYGDFFGAAMYHYGAGSIRRWRPDVIIPVPLYWRKRHIRGFNQAEYLAAVVGRYAGIPVVPEAVKKIRQTRSQKKLDAAGRRRNLQDAFWVNMKVEGLRILVIDDVYTTGSTMDAISLCLKEKGAAEIFFLTLCTGQN